MSEPLTFVRLVGEYWGMLGLRTSVRVRDALDDVENENYSFEKFARDVLGVYDDSVGIWINLTNAPDKTKPIPTLAMSVATGTDTVNKSLALGLAAGTVLERTHLMRPGAAKIDKSNVTVTINNAGDLKVALAGLNAVPVSAGFYEGLVLRTGTPIAKIQLQVT